MIVTCFDRFFQGHNGEKLHPHCIAAKSQCFKYCHVGLGWAEASTITSFDKYHNKSWENISERTLQIGRELCLHFKTILCGLQVT